MNVSQLYNLKCATLNELRKSAGLEPVEGGDIWGDEPPLDSTRISKTVTEKNRQKVLKEKYKIVFKEIIKPQQLVRKEHIVIAKKEAKEDKASFKEAVKSLLK
jgi:hypothetical protein